MATTGKHPALEALETKYPLGTLPMTTTDGTRWKNRMEASDAYFRDYSWDWKENQELLSDVRKLAKKYGTYVAITYAIVQNFVADTYYRNPDPLIQDKGGNRDLGRILSDVFRSVHQEVDSERKMKDALMDQAWAGFGCVWASFRQQAYLDPNAVDLETGTSPALVPTKQQVLLKRVSPWRIRFDPEGREWDMSDHSYVAIDYYMTLASLMRSPRLSDDDKRRLMAYYHTSQASQSDSSGVRYALLASNKEEDPEYIRVPMRHIWAKPEKKIIDMPRGASFTFEMQDWPEEFADADLFPLRYMAKNREPEDQDGLCGFIGIPDIRLIKPNVYAIQKLEALFLAANMHVINKYLMPKGALDDQSKAKLADGVKQFAVIEYDSSALSAFPQEQRDKIGPDDILTLVPQAELKDLHHLEGIRHELDMIAQIIGQGGADRGGLSDAQTATESLGMQRGLQRRLSNAIHVNGKHYNAVTKLFFIILKARQTLPIRYQMTSARFNEKAWAEFSADALTDLDLHFEYATGSSELRTREEEFSMRERMAQVLLPILQASGNVRLQMKVAQELIEPLGILGSEQFFNDEAIEIVKKLLAVIQGIGSGAIPADDVEANKQIPELISMLAQEMLTQQDMAEVVAAGAGAQPPSPEGEGSLPAAPTPGQQSYASGAAGSAAAGAGGGMAN